MRIPSTVSHALDTVTPQPIAQRPAIRIVETVNAKGRFSRSRLSASRASLRSQATAADNMVVELGFVGWMRVGLGLRGAFRADTRRRGVRGVPVRSGPEL